MSGYGQLKPRPGGLTLGGIAATLTGGTVAASNVDQPPAAADAVTTQAPSAVAGSVFHPLLVVTGAHAAGLAIVGVVVLAAGVCLVAAAALTIRLGWRRRRAVSAR